MRNRKQRRQKAVLPLKVTISVGNRTHLAHTLDISASGARIVVASNLLPGTSIVLEYKHRRTGGVVVWCKPLKDSKYDNEIGVELQNAGSNFWGVKLPIQESDQSGVIESLPFSQVINALSKQA